MVSQTFELDQSKNHILAQYGPSTAADAINKLKSWQLELLKPSNSFLDGLKSKYKKVNISLNESLKRVYLFGSQKQVIEAKAKLLAFLEKIKKTEIKLDSKELVDYLNIPEIKSKILDKLNSTFKEFNENKANQDDKENKRKSFFCTYEAISFSGNGNNENDPAAGILNVYTNLPETVLILQRFILKNIQVNFKIEVKSKSFINSIKNEDKNWSEFYSQKFNNKLTYKLEQKKSDKQESGEKRSKERWYLKLTGLNEYLDDFQLDLKSKFKLVKVN